MVIEHARVIKLIVTALVAALCVCGFAPVARAAEWLPAFDLGNTSVDDVRMTGDGDIAILVHSGAGATPGLFFRPAGGPLGPLESPFPAGAQGADIDMDAGGNSYLVWAQSGAIQTRVRLRDGSLTPVQTLAAAGLANPRVAVSAGGLATFAWVTSDGNRTILARTRHADGTLDPVHTITAAGEKTRDFDLDVAADGDATFDWTTPEAPPNTKVKARTLDFAGQTLSAILDVSIPPSPQLSDMATVAVDPAGNATLVWRRSITGAFTTETRPLSSAGTLGATQVLTTTGFTSQGHDVAVDAAGNARIAWSENAVGTTGPILPQTCIRAVSSSCGAMTQVSNTQSFLNTVAMGAGGDGMVGLSTGEVRVFPPSGGPLPIQTVTSTPTLPFLAVDGSGNGVAVWRDGETSRGAGYDAVPPVIQDVSTPAIAERGVPSAFSASVFDVWGATTTWSFGDGGTAEGQSVQHAFERTGTFNVTATATDGAGATDVETRQLTVKDTRGPNLKLGGARRQRLAHKARVMASCADEGCSLNAGGELVVRTGEAKRKRHFALRPVTAEVAAGVEAKLRLRLSKKGFAMARQALGRGGKAKVKVTAIATDVVGNDTTQRRAVRLRLKR